MTEFNALLGNPDPQDSTGGKRTTAVYAIATRLASAITSFGSGILALTLLDIDRIGVFLAFSSLAGFLAINDLGLNYSFLLAASSKPRQEVESLQQAALAALLLTVVATGFLMFVGGAVVLRAGGIPMPLWVGPWITYCVLASVYQVFFLAVVQAEGTGRRHAAWRANFWIEFAGGTLLLLAIGLRHELWALPLSIASKAILIAVMFGGEFKSRFAGTGVRPIWGRISLWREQLWPMQWKNLLNNSAGLLTTRLLTPFLLITQGAATAGRVGLALTVGLAIIATTSAWPVSQTALYTSLYHQGRGAELRSMFRSTCVLSLLLSGLACISAGVLCEILRSLSPHMASRLPDSTVLWLILGASPFGHLSICFAILVRSQRRDPVVVPNLLLTVPNLTLLWVAAQSGPLAFAGVYLIGAALFTALYARYACRLLTALRELG